MSTGKKTSFHDRFAVAIEHVTRDRAPLDGLCTCEECHKLQLYFDQKKAAENRRRRPMNLLIEIMCLRNNPSSHNAERLRAAQIEFEKLMIRKLRLHHLSSARWYGYKVDERKEAT